MNMMPDEHTRHWLEAANRDYEPFFRRAAEQGWPDEWCRLQPHMRYFAEEFRRIEEGTRQAVIRSFTFARGGWHDVPLLNVPGGALERLVDSLVGKLDEEVKAKLDQAVPEIFRRNDYDALWDMVDRWDLYSGWRRKVFEDAFQAHREGSYTLSVPALAPQIEGILRYEAEEYGRGTAWIRKVNATLNFEYDPARPPAAPTAEDLEKAINEMLGENPLLRCRTSERVSLEHALYRVNELYNHGEFSDPEFVNSTNRHAILARYIRESR